MHLCSTSKHFYYLYRHKIDIILEMPPKLSCRHQARHVFLAGLSQVVKYISKIYGEIKDATNEEVLRRACFNIRRSLLKDREMISELVRKLIHTNGLLDSHIGGENSALEFPIIMNITMVRALIEEVNRIVDEVETVSYSFRASINASRNFLEDSNKPCKCLTCSPTVTLNIPPKAVTQPVAGHKRCFAKKSTGGGKKAHPKPIYPKARKAPNNLVVKNEDPDLKEEDVEPEPSTSGLQMYTLKSEPSQSHSTICINDSSSEEEVWVGHGISRDEQGTGEGLATKKSSAVLNDEISTCTQTRDEYNKVEDSDDDITEYFMEYSRNISQQAEGPQRASTDDTQNQTIETITLDTTVEISSSEDDEKPVDVC